MKADPFSMGRDAAWSANKLWKLMGGPGEITGIITEHTANGTAYYIKLYDESQPLKERRMWRSAFFCSSRSTHAEFLAKFSKAMADMLETMKKYEPKRIMVPQNEAMTEWSA